MSLTLICTDYTLNNPDTLTKYKQAAQISQKVLEAVSGVSDGFSTCIQPCELPLLQNLNGR